MSEAKQSAALATSPLTPVEVGELWDFIHGDSPRGETPPQPSLGAHPAGQDTPASRNLQDLDQLGPDPERKPARRSFAGADAASLATEASQLLHTKDWLKETEQIWLARICPDCGARRPDLDQREEPPAGAGVRCLAHVTQPAAAEEPVTGLIDYLEELRRRVHVLGESMRQGAEPPTIEQDASWIEALGWFASWDLPLQLLDQPGDPSRT